MGRIRKKEQRIIKRNNQKDKLNVVAIGICTLFMLLVIRLFWIVIVDGDRVAAEAEEQWHSEVSVTAKRGDILDRNSSVIVASANVYRVDLDLTTLKIFVEDEKLDINEIANNLARLLGKETNSVLEILNSEQSSAILARGVEKGIVDAIKALNINGIIISDDVKRYYPNGNYLSHTLGSINSDGQGLTGIELQYDNYLAGVSGMRIGGVDAATNNMPFVPYKFTPPLDGKDIVLTIDETLQYFAENIAEKGLRDHNAKGVQVLIMDPNTGEILAMVNKPDFDPNRPYDGSENFEGENDSEQLQSMWRNGIVSDPFEPGSTFKTITMIAAMEEGVVTENEIFDCKGGTKFGNTMVKCWQTWGHGEQTLAEILKNSCNVGFMELGRRLGAEKLNEYIYKLGFGELTGIDLPGEADGIIKDSESISEIDLATIAFGQTNKVTSIQLLSAFNAIANGGDLVKPHIVKEVSHVDKNNNRVVDEKIEPIKKKNILSDENTSILREYLERTATQDGPPGSFVQGYDVGGKTGTAEKIDPATGGYSTEKYIASMVALAPVDNPQITVFLSVDEPSTGKYYGGQVASPLMKELFENIFKYMESPLAKDRYSIDKDIVIPDIRGKSLDEVEEILAENNLEYEVQGKGNIITSMNPYPGAIVKEGATIKLTLKGNTVDKKIMIPDLRGNTREFAESVLDNLGIDYTFEGEGYIHHQSISGGTIVDKGSTVKFTLRKESEY